MRKIIEHIDQRNWRTLDYFRLLENKKKVQLQNQIPSHNFFVRIIICITIFYLIY